MISDDEMAWTVGVVCDHCRRAGCAHEVALVYLYRHLAVLRRSAMTSSAIGNNRILPMTLILKISPNVPSDPDGGGNCGGSRHRGAPMSGTNVSS